MIKPHELLVICVSCGKPKFQHLLHPLYCFLTASPKRIDGIWVKRLYLRLMESYHEKVVTLAEQISRETNADRKTALIAEFRKLLDEERQRLFPQSQES